MVILAPFAGVITDRWNRKYIMLFPDMITALATFILIMLFYFGSARLSHILILLGIRGMMEGIQMPASRSVMSSMVPPNKISKMNSLNSIFNSLTGIVTPGIGALMISVFKIYNIFWLDVFTFIPAGIVLLVVKIPSIKEKNSQVNKKIEFIKDIRKSIKFLRISGLSALILYFSVINIFINPILSLLPRLVYVYHNGTAIQYGFMEIGFQVGFVLAGIYIMKKIEIPKVKSNLIWGFCLILECLIIYLVPKGNIFMLYIILGIIGITIGFLDIQFISLLQIIVPKDMQGRIFSSFFALIKSILPIALLFWGYLADSLNIHIIYLIASLGSLIVSVLLLFLIPFKSINKKINAQKENNKIHLDEQENVNYLQ